jgi:hypothetical protein
MAIFLALFLSAGFMMSCAWFANFGQPRVPGDALVGIDSSSVKILGHFRLSDWASNIPANSYLTVFEATSDATNSKEIRVFYNDDTQSFYVGALSDYFGMAEVRAIFIDLGTERCIIGWASSSIPGTLSDFHFERLRESGSYWADAQKESTIEKNLFIVPITTDVQLWNSVTMVAVQTRESLKRGFDGNGSYYQVEKTFEPALDVSYHYINISIQP